MTANSSNRNSDFILRISLNALEHLGINLYSNIPAVLSEVVANAWDADATMVNIKINKNKNNHTIIEIEDNGSGMTRQEVQDRFLTVGYQRRNNQPGPTKYFNRKPMGRKGIGKLSLFSIAEIVEVSTSKRSPNNENGQKTAFRMDVRKIRKQIEESSEGIEECSIESLPTTEFSLRQGTRIVLSSLKKTQIRPKMLKRHLARRFSIIGEENNFQIKVDGKLIGPADREYFTSLRYLWVFGEDAGPHKLCAKLDITNGFTRNPSLREGEIQVTGWIGAVHSVSKLKEEDSDGDNNLNHIAIFARGKMIQEDILADLGKRGIFSSYLVGELDVEGLDKYDGEGEKDLDAATTSRQRIVEHDPRYKILRDLINKEVTTIGNSWLTWRGEKGLELAKSIPAVGKWLNGLSKDNRKKANSWLTKVGKIQGDDLNEKKRILKHAVIAFEFYEANQNLDSLEKFEDEGLDVALRLFETLDEFEKGLYGHIVRNRIHVIKTLQEKCNKNEIEKVIQEHIYNHLWLIDPSWERTGSDSYMEQSINTIFKNIKLNKEEGSSRIDIKYRTTSGKHVVIELKRPERTLSVFELAQQINKYRTSILDALNRSDPNHGPLEFICVLGKEPKENSGPDGPELVRKTMEACSARIVYYDFLLDQARKAYQDYFNVAEKTNKLMGIIKDIEDFSVDTDQKDT